MTTTTQPNLAEETVAPDEAEVTAEFIRFLKEASAKRHPTGIMPRFNQGRAAGCVDAEFIVPQGLPAELRVGLFARPQTYRARIRFANAASQSDRERDSRGMSIKVDVLDGASGAGSENLTPGETTQDFILNSHPVMMVAGTREFLQLLQAVEAGGARQAFFFLTHPRAAAIALASRQNATSHLEISYWSTTPYLFGPGRAVKYIARPNPVRQTPLPDPLTDTYLRDRLAAHLAQQDASFDLLVQFRTDARKMPIEDASIEWREQDSPYRAVAQIRIPRQTVEDTGSPGGPGGVAAAGRCEQMSFNPWNCLVDHRPLGNFNRARRDIYHAMAEFRQIRASSGTR
jgi:hypothetical protein